MLVHVGGQWQRDPQPRTVAGVAYTVQRYRPKTPPYAGPEAFTPWIVAYVELPGEVIVEARLVDVDFDAVEIGMPVRLVPLALDPGAAEPLAIPAFAPMDGERA